MYVCMYVCMYASPLLYCPGRHPSVHLRHVVVSLYADPSQGLATKVPAGHVEHGLHWTVSEVPFPSQLPARYWPNSHDPLHGTHLILLVYTVIQQNFFVVFCTHMTYSQHTIHNSCCHFVYHPLTVITQTDTSRKKNIIRQKRSMHACGACVS